jgi:hypothetical protein
MIEVEYCYPCAIHKVMWGVAPLVFILGSKWKIMVSFSCCAALPRGNRTSSPLDRGQGGLQLILKILDKRKCKIERKFITFSNSLS